MDFIEVKEIIDPITTTDGAGVKLKRAIGTSTLDYLDPFLMLDEFGSDNVEDYIAFYIVGGVAIILLVLLYFRKRLRPCLDYFTCNKVDDDDDV